jgi:hypothetical protein
MLKLTFVLVALLALAAPASATAPPVGPLPKGPTSTITTGAGQRIAVALPHRVGKSWRIARAFDSRVARQVSEADVGNDVVLVFRAVARGKTTIRFALTRGETAKAYAARSFVIQVR